MAVEGIRNSFPKRKDFIWRCPVGVANSGHWFPSNQALSLSELFQPGLPVFSLDTRPQGIQHPKCLSEKLERPDNRSRGSARLMRGWVSTFPQSSFTWLSCRPLSMELVPSLSQTLPCTGYDLYDSWLLNLALRTGFSKANSWIVCVYSSASLITMIQPSTSLSPLSLSLFLSLLNLSLLSHAHCSQNHL